MTDRVPNVRRKFSIDVQTSDTSNKHGKFRGKFGIEDQYCEMADGNLAECTKNRNDGRNYRRLLTKFTRGKFVTKSAIRRSFMHVRLSSKPLLRVSERRKFKLE